MTILDLFEQYVVTDCSSLSEFLDRYRRAERYKGRDGKDWGEDYSLRSYNSHQNDLLMHDITWISPYESVTGKTVAYKENQTK